MTFVVKSDSTETATEVTIEANTPEDAVLEYASQIRKTPFEIYVYVHGGGQEKRFHVNGGQPVAITG